jgi:hypothetical protein
MPAAAMMPALQWPICVPAKADAAMLTLASSMGARRE